MHTLSYKFDILSLSFLIATSCFSMQTINFTLLKTDHETGCFRMGNFNQLDYILKKRPLSKEHFDEAWEVIIKASNNSKLFPHEATDLCLSSLFGVYIQTDAEIRSYALSHLSYFQSSHAKTIATIISNFERNPALPNNIREWLAAVEEAKKLPNKNKCEIERRVNCGQGTWEYQHIEPWRKHWGLMNRLANIRTNIGALTTEEQRAAHSNNPNLLERLRNEAYYKLQDFCNAETDWRKILAAEIELLLTKARVISQKQDEAALWEERMFQVPERQAPAIVHTSFSSIDEARKQSRDLLEWWNTRVNETSVAQARYDLDKSPKIENLDNFSTYVALEFSAKAIAASTSEINEQLATPAIDRDYAKLKSLTGHFTRLPELIKPLCLVTAIHSNEHRAAIPQLNTVNNILQTLHGIVVRLKKTTLQQQMQPRITMTPSLQIPAQKSPSPEYNQATASAAAAAVCACAPAYSSSNQPNIEQLFWAQQQQIMQLLEQQRKQQEQLQLLFAKVFEQKLH